MLLKSLAIASILVSGVWATEDSVIETGTEVVIKRADYANPNLGESLKKNQNVSHLTIHTNYDYREKGAYENFKNLVQRGLEDKPNLKYLKVEGDFEMNLWFQTPSTTDGNSALMNAGPIREAHFKRENSCMAWFFNLEEFIINGNVMGTWADVYQNFHILTQGMAPNLKELQVREIPLFSFKRP